MYFLDTGFVYFTCILINMIRFLLWLMFSTVHNIFQILDSNLISFRNYKLTYSKCFYITYYYYYYFNNNKNNKPIIIIIIITTEELRTRFSGLWVRQPECERIRIKMRSVLLYLRGKLFSCQFKWQKIFYIILKVLM